MSCEIPFLEMYTFIYFTLLVFNLWQKQISQKLQFCEGGTRQYTKHAQIVVWGAVLRG